MKINPNHILLPLSIMVCISGNYINAMEQYPIFPKTPENIDSEYVDALKK